MANPCELCGQEDILSGRIVQLLAQLDAVPQVEVRGIQDHSAADVHRPRRADSQAGVTAATGLRRSQRAAQGAPNRLQGGPARGWRMAGDEGAPQQVPTQIDQPHFGLRARKAQRQPAGVLRIQVQQYRLASAAALPVASLDQDAFPEHVAGDQRHRRRRQTHLAGQFRARHRCPPDQTQDPQAVQSLHLGGVLAGFLHFTRILSVH
jgi:hypothetical protein